MNYTPINKLCRAHQCVNPAVRRCPGCGWDFCEEHIKEGLIQNIYPTALAGVTGYAYTLDIPDDTWLCMNCDCDEDEDD